MYAVYCIIFPNNKMYIGLTKNFRLRKNAHRCTKGHLPINRAMQKYLDEERWLICATGCTQTQARNIERTLIAQFNTQNSNFGYNCTAGGDGPSQYVVGKETRAKMSAAKKGKRWTEHQRAALMKYHARPRKQAEASVRAFAAARELRKVELKAIATDGSHGFFFSSTSEAAKVLDVYRQNIRHVRKGTLRSTGGYTFA